MIWKTGRVLLALICALTLATGNIAAAQEAAVLGEPEIFEPEVTKDDSFSTGLCTEWACILFGSYPMAEVVPGAFDAVDAYAVGDGDVLTDAALYEALENAEWEKDETELDGIRYRRMNAEGAVSWARDRSQHYRWGSPEAYHYFRVEPLKWRILELEDDGVALLLADRLYDAEPYNLSTGPVTWQTSTLRSWLNGYPAEENAAGISYAGEGFIDRAFTEEERKALVVSEVKNESNARYGTGSGPDTRDTAFLLSNAEVFASETAARYGFYAGNGKDDASKRFRATMYAKCRGAWWSPVESYRGNTFWFMRNNGYTPENVTYICDFGYIYDRGTSAACDDGGVLIALRADLDEADWEIAEPVTSYDILDKTAKNGEGKSRKWLIGNPVTTEDISLPGGMKTAYSMVSFGSYPQAEVVRTAEEGSERSIVDPGLYAVLEGAEWAGSIAEADGGRFLRTTGENGEARYFAFEPILWRVLEVNDGTALLEAAAGLECLPFHEKQESVSWATCTLRSRLNGYGGAENLCGIDYSGAEDNFADLAFTAEEQEALLEYPVRNQDNYYFGMDSGADTADRVFILAEPEFFVTDSSEIHGFSRRDEVHDLAKRYVPTDFARFRGAWQSVEEETAGNGFWITRTTGYDSANVVYVDEYGSIFNRGISVTCADALVIPAVRLDLDAEGYEYAGTYTTGENGFLYTE